MDFYIYRYIRLDTNTPFYVGKGKDKRANNIAGHNAYCRRIAEKHGFMIERMINNISEDFAHAKEIEFIALYKAYGWCEANLTNGGEGSSGYKHKEKSKQKMSKPGKLNPMYGKSRPDLAEYNKSQTGKSWEEIYGEEKAKTAKQKKRLDFKEKWKDSKYREKTSESIKEAKLKNNAKVFNVYKAICVQPRRRGISAIYEKGEFVGIWKNKSTCAKDLKIKDKNISSCLNGKYKQMYGYIFEYKRGLNWE